LVIAAAALVVIAVGGAVAWLVWPGPKPPLVAGALLRDCPDCPELVVIPAGTFTMGSPDGETGHDSDESPLHPVTVPAPLAVGRTPVTRAEYQRFVTATGARPAGCTVLKTGFAADPAADWRNPGFDQTDRHPVACVSWTDAQAYVGWLSRTTGQPYRLPTEAEWEYAARAGTTTPWFWGADPANACQHANLADHTAQDKLRTNGRSVFLACDDGFVYTSPVGQFPANAFQLFDMAGNLFQWVADCYGPDYKGAAAVATEARNPAACPARVIRGGAWSSSAKQARAAARVSEASDARVANIGFRVVRDLGR
jgi:formylglycine-generating enzyme required for sulfatase activity